MPQTVARAPRIRRLATEPRVAPRHVVAECATACEAAVSYCLERGGDLADRGAVLSLLDCAEAAHLAARFHGRDSDLADQAFRLLAQAARAAEQACRCVPGDARLAHCADTCANALAFADR